MTVHHEDHWIATPQARLFARSWRPIRDAGADPFILFHDSLGSVELWRGFPAALCAATHRRVVAYDRWGFGRSDPRHGAMPPSFIVDEAPLAIPAICDQLGIERFVAFGHSVGGCMAICAAGEFPDRVAAVISESAQPFVEERTREGIRATQAQFAHARDFARLERYHGDKARWVLDAWTQTWLSDRFASWTLDAQLKRVRCPLLVIHGDQDEYGSVAHPRRIGELAAGPSKVVIMEGVGHIPHREKPAEVIEMVRGFCEHEAWLTARRTS